MQTSTSPFYKDQATVMATRLADPCAYGLVGVETPEASSALPEAAAWWQADATLPCDGFHKISPRLRDIALSLDAPVVDQTVLGAIEAIEPEEGPVIVSLPLPARPAAPAALRPYLAARNAKTVCTRMVMLREYRRECLGLSARLSAETIDEAIYRAFILPVAAQVLRLGSGLTKLHVTAETPPEGASVRRFAPFFARGDDPLSQNIFALAMRTGFHGQRAALMRPWLRLSPFQFGRAAARSSSTPSPVLTRLALAVPQLTLLCSIKPEINPQTQSETGLKGTSHV